MDSGWAGEVLLDLEPTRQRQNDPTVRTNGNKKAELGLRARICLRTCWLALSVTNYADLQGFSWMPFEDVLAQKTTYFPATSFWILHRVVSTSDSSPSSRDSPEVEHEGFNEQAPRSCRGRKEAERLCCSKLGCWSWACFR